MELDDDLCLCFHVSKRKVINFIRNEKPSTASQLSECYGAGTGCGWCRSYLEALHNQLRGGSSVAGDHFTAESLTDSGQETAESYATLRQDYLKKRSDPPSHSL